MLHSLGAATLCCVRVVLTWLICDLFFFPILFLEVEMDKSRTWCPQAGCETVCTLCSTDRCTPQSVHCPTCKMDFCSNCRAAWHADSPCKSEEVVPGVTFDSELIKCCPMCSVPIEKDEGCAQMLCKRCKHVFCWYCLASLDVSI